MRYNHIIGLRVSFEEFINWIASGRSGADEHWTPISTLCSVCSMNFNFISIAVIYNNTEVFNSLKALCDRKSLGIPSDADDANDFTALDYSSILQRSKSLLLKQVFNSRSS